MDWGRLRGERGTALVEFALLAPLLFVLVLGMLDFSRGLAYYNDVTQLAAEGARAASVDRNPLDPNAADPRVTACGAAQTTPTATSIQCQLWQSAISPELQGTNPGPNNSPPLQVCIDTVPGQVGQNVTIHATKTLHLFPLLRLGSLNLTGSTTMRAEVVPAINGVVNIGYATGCYSGP